MNDCYVPFVMTGFPITIHITMIDGRTLFEVRGAHVYLFVA